MQTESSKLPSGATSYRHAAAVWVFCVMSDIVVHHLSSQVLRLNLGPWKNTIRRNCIVDAERVGAMI